MDALALENAIISIMKLFALLSALLITVIIAAVPTRAVATSSETSQECTTSTQPSSACCQAVSVDQASQPDYTSQENCGERFGIVKTIIPIIGIILLAGGIIGAVVWERRRLG